MSHELSTGQPSTLRSYLTNCLAVFGPDSPTIQFIKDKAKECPKGLDEIVVTDERQMIYLLRHIHFGRNGGDDNGR